MCYILSPAFRHVKLCRADLNSAVASTVASSTRQEGLVQINILPRSMQTQQTGKNTLPQPVS